MAIFERRASTACAIAWVAALAACNDGGETARTTDGGTESFGDASSTSHDDGGSAQDAGSDASSEEQTWGPATLSEQCPAPPDCGGDPAGSWRLSAGCTEASPSSFDCDSAFEGFEGSVSGTLLVGETGLRYPGRGEFEIEVDNEFRQCGWSDSGGGGVSGDYVLEGDNVMRVSDDLAYTFCVQGDTLYLATEGEGYPDLTTFTFERVAP